MEGTPIIYVDIYRCMTNNSMEDDALVVSPKELVRYACKRKKFTIKDVLLPPAVVLAAPSFIDVFGEQFFIEGVEKTVLNNHYRVGGMEMALIQSRTGGPAMALDLEVMITLSASFFIHIGFAGGLSSDMNPGDIIISKGALSETGIPPLYGFHELLVPSDPWLTNSLIGCALRKIVPIRSGVHWCTDAPYREKKGKIAKYTKEGALCVEMEGSALFGVSKFYKAHAAAVYVVSDVITEEGWRQTWYTEEMLKGCRKAVELVGSFVQEYKAR
jgi:uridine phosphorylase